VPPSNTPRNTLATVVARKTLFGALSFQAAQALVDLERRVRVPRGGRPFSPVHRLLLLEVRVHVAKSGRFLLLVVMCKS
jgi:hypothetical protein